MRLRKFFVLFLGLLQGQLMQAQLCQGSFGDPIVNISFGAGANPGPQLSAASTFYQFVSTDCPPDGYYTVRNNTNGCFLSSWHPLAADHTGNANGYFMLVNASVQPGAFYIDTVDVFCSNTTYEFAAWVMNVVKPASCSGNAIQPNLTFSIEKTDGTILQTYNSGNIPPQSEPKWVQQGFFFTTPPSVSRIVIRIVNNAIGGCGNDLALDDITFRPCGPLVNATLNGSGNTRNICEGETAQFNLSSTISPGFSAPYVQWQQSTDGGITWIDIAGANATTLLKDFPSTTPVGTYLYRAGVSKLENTGVTSCRVNSGVLKINVNANPITSATTTGPVCEENSITLSATGGTQYKWTGVNGFTATGSTVSLQNVQTLQSGKYYVQVTNAAGCSHLDSTNVIINPRPIAIASTSPVSICEGETTVLQGSGGSSYAWYPATGLSASTISNPEASPKDSTLYSVVVSNIFNCADTAYVQVNVIRNPVANAGPDKSILEGQQTSLSGFVSGSDISYYWSPSTYIDNINLLQPTVQPPATITYLLHVNSNAGCPAATDSVKVNVYKAVYVPNAFSPNGDAVNDTWKIPALSVYNKYEILVFNRYGQIVFKSENNTIGWDGKFNGKPQPAGVYCYLIKIKQAALTLSGWIMLVK